MGSGILSAQLAVGLGRPDLAASRMEGLLRAVFATLRQPLLTGNGARLEAAGMNSLGDLPQPPAQA